MARNSLCTLAGLLTLGALAAPAVADDDPKRAVVVLEYRAGAADLPELGRELEAGLASMTSLRVMGLNEARQKLARLDDAVASCAGDAACIAGLGRKLGVREVVLLGVSEMGDVIVTLQRIDVDGRTVAHRIAESMAPGEAVDREGVRRYLTRLMPPSDFARFGTLKVIADQDGATVTLDGATRGATPIEALVVPAPGTYRVRLDKRDYVPFAAEVEVPPDSTITVRATLERRAAPTRWYQKWWVVSIGGAVIAGAAGSAIYFGTRDTPSSVPVSGQLD